MPIWAPSGTSAVSSAAWRACRSASPVASRLRGRIGLAAAALAMCAAALQPAVVARAGLDDSSDPSCPAASGLPQGTGQGVAITAKRACLRRGAHSFGGTASRANEQRRLNNPVAGDHCTNISYHPVTFGESDQGLIRANFQLGSANSSIGLSPEETIQAATFEAIVAEAQDGQYQPSAPADPTSPLTCVLDPRPQDYCPTADHPLGTFCYIWILHGITPATSPMPAIAPFMAAIAGDIRGAAGTIGSAPSEKGVVNTPVCFWVDGMGIPVERDLVLKLAGPPDDSGRRIFYTLLARIRFQGVDWDFGDPFDNAQTQPAAACGDHPQMTAHRYRQISDDLNADHRYHVTAHERYNLAADVFWVDSDGPHHQSVDPGVPDPVATPPDYAQYVGQVEGIPVGG